MNMFGYTVKLELGLPAIPCRLLLTVEFLMSKRTVGGNGKP